MIHEDKFLENNLKHFERQNVSFHSAVSVTWTALEGCVVKVVPMFQSSSPMHSRFNWTSIMKNVLSVLAIGLSIIGHSLAADDNEDVMKTLSSCVFQLDGTLEETEVAPLFDSDPAKLCSAGEQLERCLQIIEQSHQAQQILEKKFGTPNFVEEFKQRFGGLIQGILALICIPGPSGSESPFAQHIKSQLECLNKMFTEEKICQAERFDYLNAKPFDILQNHTDEQKYTQELCCSRQHLFTCAFGLEDRNSTELGHPCVPSDGSFPDILNLIRPVILNRVTEYYCQVHLPSDVVCSEQQPVDPDPTDAGPLVNDHATPSPTPSGSSWLAPVYPLLGLLISLHLVVES